MWEVVSGAALLVKGIVLSSMAIVVIVIVVVGWFWLSIYAAYWAYCCLMLSSIAFKSWRDGGRRLEVGWWCAVVSSFIFLVDVIVAVALVSLLSSFVSIVAVLAADTTRAKVSGRVGGS